MKFRQMEENKESMSEMVSFVDNLGFVDFWDLIKDDYDLHVRLESLLIETLKENYKQKTLAQLGLTTTNAKLLKKKLRKKQKKQAE